MANILTGNPIVLDTFSSAIDLGTSLFADANAKFKVKSITWVKPTSTDHTLLITDGGGSRTIAAAKCGLVNETTEVCPGGWFAGIKVAQSGVGSGTVLIYLE